MVFVLIDIIKTIVIIRFNITLRMEDRINESLISTFSLALLGMKSIQDWAFFQNLDRGCLYHGHERFCKYYRI